MKIPFTNSSRWKITTSPEIADNEANYCGQSPVHLAIQTRNFHITSAVVLASDPDILNTADNQSDYPLDMTARITCPFLLNGPSLRNDHKPSFHGSFENNSITLSYSWLPMYVSWMIRRGIDIGTAIPTGSILGAVPKSAWAHFLMASLGFRARVRRHSTWEFPPNIAEVATSQLVVNGCLCLCSGQGCTPSVKFLAALDSRGISAPWPKALENYALRASDFFEDLLPGYKLG
ncbi:hypothetical protein FCOIX_7843 [Fusarium coicis]|nr:hypothetical protein FCOIX_7843 [Fusarium coicis]